MLRNQLKKGLDSDKPVTKLSNNYVLNKQSEYNKQRQTKMKDQRNMKRQEKNTSMVMPKYQSANKNAMNTPRPSPYHNNSLQSQRKYYSGKIIQEENHTSSFNFPSQDKFKKMNPYMNTLELQQKKTIQVSKELSKTSNQAKLFKMSCGHNIGPDLLSQIVKSRVNENKYDLRCPYVYQEGIICNQIWEFKQIVGLKFLKEHQQSDIQQKLSLNWMSTYSKQCPKCKIQFYKVGFEGNRITCPSCKYGQFCYLCLRKWQDPKPMLITSVNWDTLTETTKEVAVKSRFCGSHQCYTLNYEIKDDPIRDFKLFDPSNSKKRLMSIKAPESRPCPFCGVVGKNSSQGKHVTCRVCTKSFCWICQSTPIEGVWICGKLNEYCGKVDQNQLLSYK